MGHIEPVHGLSQPSFATPSQSLLGPMQLTIEHTPVPAAQVVFAEAGLHELWQHTPVTQNPL